MSIEDVFELIKKDPRFLNLKNYIENNGYHNHQSVYDHTLLVFEKAKEEISGDFIENQEAKKAFTDFFNEVIQDVKRKDCLLLAALLHDIAKSAFYKEGKEKEAVLKIDKDGQTTCPGNEYISSLIAPKILRELVPDQAISYVSKIISKHGSINAEYFEKKKEWKIEDLVNDLKLQSEGVYVESLFHIYCDVFFAKPGALIIETAIKVFNQPSFYRKRQYYLK